MHLEIMYNINEPEKAGHEKRDKGKVLQHCLCKVSVKSGITMGALDLTTCYSLLRGFFLLTPEQKLNLKYVIEQRNVINKYLNEKTLEGELFSKIWDQLQIPTLIIAAEIDPLFADEIFNKIKILKRTKPSMKHSIQCYETYLEWFSRDDILRQEIRHAKLQRRLLSPSLPSIPEDQNRKMLIIIEVIMINLLKNLDGDQTEVERLPPDGMEAHDKEEPKKHDNVYNKIILKDPVISGVNAPTQNMQKKCVTIETTVVPVVLETDNSKSDIQNKVIDNDQSIQYDYNEKADLTDMETQTEEEDMINPENINQIEEKNDIIDAVYHNVEIILQIPGKTSCHIEDRVNDIQSSVDEISTESMKIHSLSVQSDVVSIQAKLSHTLFEDRSTLRDVTSEVLHKLFHMCRIADNFSVDVTFKIEGVNGIDPSKFIIKEVSDKEITKDGENLLDRNATFSTETSMSPLTLTPDILNECQQCKEKDKEIFTLQKKVLNLQAEKNPLPNLKCKDCVKKDKQIFLLEQDQLKITNANDQKDRLIHTLHTDIATKESTIKSYVRLDRTNSVLNDQMNTKNDLKKKRLAHLYKKYSSSLFYTRPTSEQVLKKPVNSSISNTNKKYLSSIRRYKDFIPTRQMAVVRYSNSDAKWKGQPKAPLFPSINLVVKRDKQLLRPFSVRGKHVDLENASMAKDTGNRKRHILDLSLPRM
ncbi:Hypothetical predicted protein [Mytilus galloprovincialis]|uniref:Uncharacterized protein n=1 Tax=Mytilus galloprovincialis TaxID=29158 RepID=A0A8B6HKL1_MYTGA|nr:Hypothetical predicted protein [Mytilus galloprovincialis]